MSDLLSVEDLHVSFRLHGGLVEAVKGVSFSIPEGGSVALVGESGSGKTVVSQAIMRILPEIAVVPKGRILFRDPNKGREEVDLLALPSDGRKIRAIRGGRISIIFQEPMTSLSPLHTIGDQVGEALRLHRQVSSQECKRITAEMLGLVGFPEPVRALKTYPFELSGGLRQRAMIAMALVCRPALLVADEPTTALDVTIQAQILKLIKDLQAELGMAMLVITHDLGVVANVAEQVVVMYHGDIMEMGQTREIFSSPRHPYLKALMNAVPRFDMKPGERLVPLREIEAQTGHMLKPRSDPQKTERGKTLLAIDGITKTYRIRKSGWVDHGTESVIRAVNDVSFDVRRGECLGLVGESGCGKTTLSKIIMRALAPDTGTIRFGQGADVADVQSMKGDALTDYRRRVQFIFQDPFSSLNPRMTVFDIVNEPLVIHKVGTKAERREMIAELLRLVGLDPRHLNRYPHSFSGGQRQRIGIARALALRPELLICDEPVSALDVSIQAQILNLLKDLQEKLGLTYLFVSHNLAVVDYMADRIAVMCAGRIVELAPRAALFKAPAHPYTRALLAAVPEPDPTKRLDLSALMEGKASVPEAWPEPFRLDEGRPDRLHDLGEGHWVRATDGAVLTELVA